MVMEPTATISREELETMTLSEICERLGVDFVKLMTAEARWDGVECEMVHDRDVLGTISMRIKAA